MSITKRALQKLRNSDNHSVSITDDLYYLNSQNMGEHIYNTTGMDDILEIAALARRYQFCADWINRIFQHEDITSILDYAGDEEARDELEEYFDYNTSGIFSYSSGKRYCKGFPKETDLNKIFTKDELLNFLLKDLRFSKRAALWEQDYIEIVDGVYIYPTAKQDCYDVRDGNDAVFGQEVTVSEIIDILDEIVATLENTEK